jgi:hypothetical protein
VELTTMAQLKDFTIRYRVKATGLPGLRLGLAKILISIIAVLLKVRVKPEVDDRRATREAEVAPNRAILRGKFEQRYRGTVVTEKPRSTCIECGKTIDSTHSFEYRGKSPLCWDCFDAQITPLAGNRYPEDIARQASGYDNAEGTD